VQLCHQSGWLFIFNGAAYNLCRLRNLMART
jgi:hypothetical protein